MSVLRNVADALRDRVERQNIPGNARERVSEARTHCPGCRCPETGGQAVTEPSTAEVVTGE